MVKSFCGTFNKKFQTFFQKSSKNKFNKFYLKYTKEALTKFLKKMNYLPQHFLLDLVLFLPEHLAQNPFSLSDSSIISEDTFESLPSI